MAIGLATTLPCLVPVEETPAVHRSRYLVVTADDFGIGPQTSQGILDLAARRSLTATVLLTNAPFAEAAVQAWRRAGRPLELGWHPCLTTDAPVLAPSQVPTLVDRDGRFHPLGGFLRRLMLGHIRTEEIEAELLAQYHRFHDLVGRPPSVVNSHHHVQLFPPVGAVLYGILQRSRPLPYVRRVCESWGALSVVPGARRKRLLLSTLGRRDARRQRRLGFRGNDWLAGITDPPCVADPDFLRRWLAHLPPHGVMELTCHPGYLDTSLLGRDATLTDGQLQRRLGEFNHLAGPRFVEACRRGGYTLVSPTEFLDSVVRKPADAA
jgi:predicted glycoside hydrolase/deacetylase ChbG (UPF0249 family)